MEQDRNRGVGAPETKGNLKQDLKPATLSTHLMNKRNIGSNPVGMNVSNTFRLLIMAVIMT